MTYSSDFYRLSDRPGLCDRHACWTVPFAEFRLRHEDAFREIRRLLAFEGPWERCALGSTENLLRYLYLAPASGSHHHAYPGGLVEHTLAVAITALSEIGDSCSPQIRLLTLLAALLHDVGKVAHMLVKEHVDHECCLPLTWSYESEPLADWVKKHHLEAISFSWIQGRQQVGPGSSVPMSLLLQKHIIHEPLDPLVGIRGINQLLACQTGQLPGADPDGIAEVVRKADVSSLSAGRAQSDSFKARFFKALAAALARTRARINQPNGEVFISTTHTIVALPHERDGRLGGTAWREACAMIAPEAGGRGVDAITDLVLSDVSMDLISRNRSTSRRKPAVFHIGCGQLRPSVIIPNRCFGLLLSPLMPLRQLTVPLDIQDLHCAEPPITREALGVGDPPRGICPWAQPHSRDGVLRMPLPVPNLDEDELIPLNVPPLEDPAVEARRRPPAPRPDVGEVSPPPPAELRDPHFG